MELNRLGHLAYVFIASGQVLVAHYHPAGWALRLVGEALWLWIGWRLGMSSIWTWGCLFVALELYGLLSWSA